MNAQLKEKAAVNQRVMDIAQIREKVRLLNKCQRKMQLAALDPDSLKILTAAFEQLTDEINRLCRQTGL